MSTEICQVKCMTEQTEVNTWEQKLFKKYVLLKQDYQTLEV
jgi:hypothetical protein